MNENIIYHLQGFDKVEHFDQISNTAIELKRSDKTSEAHTHAWHWISVFFTQQPLFAHEQQCQAVEVDSVQHQLATTVQVHLQLAGLHLWFSTLTSGIVWNFKPATVCKELCAG
jgi:hypothetical protein